ncbi:MAG: SRPBCC family protein, partial [Vicinamibacterales bacterium]
AWDWRNRIDAWEPSRRLRLVDDRYVPFDVHGQPMPEGRVRPAPVAIEITLEAHAGTTRLRLVHSGFERGKVWDDEFEGISTGWPSELRNLKYYLERFRGRDRVAAMARQSAGESRGAAWRRVLSDGYGLEPASVTEGAPYSARTPGGKQLTGTILTTLPDREFSGSVREMGDGIFRVATHCAGGETGVMVWFSSYRLEDRARVEELRGEAQTAIDRLFERSTTL